MIKSAFNSIVNRLHKSENPAKEKGTKSRNNHTQPGIQLHSYLRADGSMDYEAYRQIQTEGNKRKINNVWVLEENIAFLSKYLRSKLTDLNFGICHGTRRGKEQEWFRKHLGCEVIGTEISDTATSFPHTIQWDFHQVKEEWINSVDFIYSNSFDHTYDPEMCINSWMRCVRPGGLCVLEHTSEHERAKELDPFGAHLTYMPYLILTWGKGSFFTREILDAPKSREGLSYTRFLVIQKG